MRSSLPSFALLLLLSSSAWATFDDSLYRQNTYGRLPDRYCDPTKPLTDNSGNGLTEGTAWNLNQCAANPTAGQVVGILPVGAGVPVRMATSNDDNVPAFNPANSGTINNRIVFVTKYAAVAMNPATVATNPNRSEFRHNGSAPSIVGGIGVGNGCAMLGARVRNYITYDGFFIDMAQAYMKEDSGVIRADESTGTHFKNFVIKGATLTVASNAVIYRPDNATDTVLSNFRAFDFDNVPTGSATPQNALFSDQYGDQNFLIEHFEIDNTERGIFLKGSAGPGFANLNYGTIRYGVVRNVSSCYQFNALHQTQLTTVQYALCHHTSEGGGVVMSSETAPARNLLIDHVTVAKVDASSINTEGGIITRSMGIGANVVITNNVVDVDNGPFGHQVALSTQLPMTLDYNVYFKNGGNESYTYNGTQFNSFTTWLAAIGGRDTHSLELTSSPFVDRAANDFHIAVGHPAKTASSTGAEVGCYAAPAVVGVDVVVDLLGPAAPTSLTVE